jgi:trehalose utilization protein
MKPIRVTIWNEYRHEKTDEKVKRAYPEGIHNAIAAAFADPLVGGSTTDFTVKTATLDEPEHGLTKDVLDTTDVLFWWGHMAHGEVSDDIVKRVQDRVLGGMGLVVLHSAHASKIFTRMLGASGRLRWREADEKVRLFNLRPDHAITQGIPDSFELPAEEMYGERFGIPDPDELIFLEWFQGGDVFRGGCCFRREKGKIFYFQPGHETYPQYHNPIIRRILTNAARWAAPLSEVFPELDCPNVPLFEQLPGK